MFANIIHYYSKYLINFPCLQKEAKIKFYIIINEEKVCLMLKAQEGPNHAQQEDGDSECLYNFWDF